MHKITQSAASDVARKVHSAGQKSGLFGRGAGLRHPERLELVGVVLQIMQALEMERIELRRNDVLNSKEWKKLRYQALLASDGRCKCCGASAANGAVLHVDHIKPKSLYPELALVFSNLQVLCGDCNIGKSNIDETDWAKKTLERIVGVVVPTK